MAKSHPHVAQRLAHHVRGMRPSANITMPVDATVWRAFSDAAYRHGVSHANVDRLASNLVMKERANNLRNLIRACPWLNELIGTGGGATGAFVDQLLMATAVSYAEKPLAKPTKKAIADGAQPHQCILTGHTKSLKLMTLTLPEAGVWTQRHHPIRIEPKKLLVATVFVLNIDAHLCLRMDNVHKECPDERGLPSYEIYRRREKRRKENPDIDYKYGDAAQMHFIRERDQLAINYNAARALVVRAFGARTSPFPLPAL